LLRSKKIALLTGCLFIGAALGFLGGFYAYKIYPQVHAMKVAQATQARLSGELRHGAITSMGTDTVAIKVTQGPADLGKTLALRANPNTTIQVGSAVLNRSGEPADLTRWYKVGDTVDMLTKDDLTMDAIFRPLKQGEQPVETIQQSHTPTAGR
jgi:hypothetical protein